MRIGIVLYDMQAFGGLEELTTSLAIGLKQNKHEVTVLSTAWVNADNQYLARLSRGNVPFWQLPKWLSLPISDWNTKEKIQAQIVWLGTPFLYLPALVLMFAKKRSWAQSFASTRGWLRTRILQPLIRPDRRKPLVRLMLRWWQFRCKPELIHLQGYTENLLFVLDWAEASGIATVYQEHQTPDKQFDWWKKFAQTINRATTIIAVSKTSAQALLEVCQVTKPIAVAQPLLADPMPPGWRRKQDAYTARNPICVTAIARLYVTKGIPYLLQAIAHVKRAFPDTTFCVYGEGPLRADFLALARELGLAGEAIFPGAFTDRKALNDILTRTDIFVLPSILEGQPLSVLEAMAYGCPIVATRVGGVPEIIEDGTNGLLCPPADPACLAEKLCALIADPLLRFRLGTAARQSFVQGPYQPHMAVEFLERVYREAIERNQLTQSAPSVPEQSLSTIR